MFARGEPCVASWGFGVVRQDGEHGAGEEDGDDAFDEVDPGKSLEVSDGSFRQTVRGEGGGCAPSPGTQTSHSIHVADSITEQ